MAMLRTSRIFLSGDTLKIWTNPRGSPNIVVFVRGTLYVSAIKAKDLDRAVQLLSVGAVPEQVFGDYHRAVPLAGVTRVEADLRRCQFRLTYDIGVEKSQLEFQLASRAAADELVVILRHQLGPLYRESPLQFDILKAWAAPLAALVIHGALMYFAWGMTAAVSGVRHRTSGLERWLQDRAGREGVLQFGVFVAAVLAVWMLSRLVTRPVGVQFRRPDA